MSKSTSLKRERTYDYEVDRSSRPAPDPRLCAGSLSRRTGKPRVIERHIPAECGRSRSRYRRAANDHADAVVLHRGPALAGRAGHRPRTIAPVGAALTNRLSLTTASGSPEATTLRRAGTSLPETGNPCSLPSRTPANRSRAATAAARKTGGAPVDSWHGAAAHGYTKFHADQFAMASRARLSSHLHRSPNWIAMKQAAAYSSGIRVITAASPRTLAPTASERVCRAGRGRSRGPVAAMGRDRDRASCRSPPMRS
jgi:hypothetical protein